MCHPRLVMGQWSPVGVKTLVVGGVVVALSTVSHFGVKTLIVGGVVVTLSTVDHVGVEAFGHITHRWWWVGGGVFHVLSCTRRDSRRDGNARHMNCFLVSVGAVAGVQ